MIRVDGESMLETLQDGDRLAATIIDGKLFGYKRGDVVICTYPDADHYCVKRVIGLPGEDDFDPAGRRFHQRQSRWTSPT